MQLLLRYMQDPKSLSFLLLFVKPIDMVHNALGYKQTLAMWTGHTAQGSMPLAMVVDKTRGVAPCERTATNQTHKGVHCFGSTLLPPPLALICHLLPCLLHNVLGQNRILHFLLPDTAVLSLLMPFVLCT